MHIANPIYDVVFKYMLEDNKVAKLFLSAIIGEEITELEFSAQERTVEIKEVTIKKKIKKKKDKENEKEEEKIPLTVCRLDFSAKIKTDTGFKTVIIELQKAKYLSDLMRFRRYLGIHYQDPANTSDLLQEEARQIYCIYFLGYGMDLPESPVLKVFYTMKDVSTGDVFPASGDFVTGLHHQSWIVQINQLKKNRRNDLEKLLSIFDQSNLTNLRYIVNVDDEDFPKEYQIIIRRLRKAMEDPKKRREMELEDDIIKGLQDLERMIEQKEKVIETQNKVLAEKDQVLAEKDQVLAEKDQVLAEKDQVLAEKDQVLADQAQALAEKDQILADQAQALAELKKELAKYKPT